MIGAPWNDNRQTALLVLEGDRMVFKSLDEDYICLKIASAGVGGDILCKRSLT